MSGPCCWRASLPGSANLRFERRSAQAAAISSANSSRKVQCWWRWERPPVSLSTHCYVNSSVTSAGPQLTIFHSNSISRTTAAFFFTQGHHRRRQCVKKKAAVVLEMEFEWKIVSRSEEHTSELQSPCNLVCRLLLEK